MGPSDHTGFLFEIMAEEQERVFGGVSEDNDDINGNSNGEQRVEDEKNVEDRLLDAEFEDTGEELLDAATIFESVNLPTIEELQNLHCPSSSQNINGRTNGEGCSTSSSSASVSSPSSSWVPTQYPYDADHHSSCPAPSTQSIDQEGNICTDSATSSSFIAPFTCQENTPNNQGFHHTTNFESQQGSLSDGEKIDILQELQNLELLDGSGVWDSCFGFDAEDGFRCDANGLMGCDTNGKEDLSSSTPDELPMVFFEWLKSNRDSISPEDLRSIKLKRSTIEAAAKQLGGGKKGMLSLLKLILAWVQHHHLQRKRKLREAGLNPAHYMGNLTMPSFMEGVNMSTISPGNFPWQAEASPLGVYSNTQGLYSEPSMFPSLSPMENLHNAKYRRAPMEEAHGFEFVPQHPNHLIDSALPWQMGMINGAQIHQPFCNGGLVNPCLAQPPSQLGSEFGNGFRNAAPAASTKEARKNRMARQRRSLAHHHHHNRQWPSATSLPPQSTDSVNYSMSQFPQRQTSFMHSERRQGYKPENNLKCLIQKVLKQSDVGNLGRIVLPKKEAEANLPELEARDGINIPLEDMTTSRVWNMRYRFWPNNKSRMYLLENTGEFVRTNNLQEGDFILIYQDTKTSKYMIRGVKVPQVPRADTTNNTSATTTTITSSTSSAGVGVAEASAPTPKKSKNTSNGMMMPDVDTARLFSMIPSYMIHTSSQGGGQCQAVGGGGVTFADSMADASSSSVSDPRASSFLIHHSNNHYSANQGLQSALPPSSASPHAPQPPPPTSAAGELERFPSLESGDLTIEEILDLVDSPNEENPNPSMKE